MKFNRNIYNCRVFTFLFLSSFISISLNAQEANPDSLLKVNVDLVEKMLKQDKIKTDYWWWGWLTGYSAATVAQSVIGFQSSKLNTRQDMYLSAATTLVGAVGQFVTPVMPSKALSQLAALPDRTPDEKQKKLEAAEDMLQRRAWAESKGRGWHMHAMSGAVNLSSGLITWIGFKRTWKDGLLNFAINTVVTEAQIWSQPMHAKKELEQYKRTNFLSYRTLSRGHRCTYVVSARSEGLGVSVIF